MPDVPQSESRRQTATFQLKDLPDSLTDPAFHTIKQHVTALGIENRVTKSLTPIGSGTFVRWGDHFGVLTAEHVVNDPEDPQFKLDTSETSEQILRLTIVDTPHELGFDTRGLKVFNLGPRINDEDGPDIAIIELPNSSALKTIAAIKSFWNLTHRTEERMHRALDPIGCVFIAGHLAEDLRTHDDVPGFTDVLFAPGIIGLTGQDGYFTKGNLDYLEVASEQDGNNQAPTSWRGVSGGSLWRLPVARTAEGAWSVGEVTLAGVPFIEEYMKNPGHRRVCGHGPLTIYRELLARLPK